MKLTAPTITPSAAMGRASWAMLALSSLTLSCAAATEGMIEGVHSRVSWLPTCTGMVPRVYCLKRCSSREDMGLGVQGIFHGPRGAWMWR